MRRRASRRVDDILFVEDDPALARTVQEGLGREGYMVTWTASSRAQILDAVWGYDADVESERTVNAHIRRLREKVGLDPSHPALILTVPGIGEFQRTHSTL